jgi:hypothetical protein
MERISRRRNMIKTVSVILSFLLVYIPCIHAYADPPPPCVTPTHVTEPCTGVLLPPEAASKALTCLKYDLPKLQLKLDQEKALFVNFKTYSVTLRQTEKRRGDDYKALLGSALQVSGPKWYEHPVFWFAMGFIVATGTTVGITYAVNSK